MENVKCNINSLNNYGDIVIPVLLTCDIEDNMRQEEIVKTTLINDIKANIIPPCLDMEKIIFSPVFEDMENGDFVYKDVQEIEFNFHFRERKNEDGWPVDEDKAWNGISIGDSYALNKMRKSDLLSYLNFTEDDVHYQQAKLKKTFMRMSFYDSNEPLSQQLLAYSTVFFDSGELFGKYSQGIKIDSDVSDSEFDGDNSKRLDTRLTIKDKFNIEKSSEGFYLYLFNDEVTPENSSKDIYLKVEFNHAGYGYTLPFTRPYPGETAQPIPLKGEGVTLFDCMFIRIRLKYLENENRYVYYIPKDDIDFGTYVDTDNQKIIFNLFEANVV